MTTVAFAFPLLPRPARLALTARWSRQLLDALGVRLRVSGSPIDGGLFVANHISWLDIYTINAFAPAAFVAKDEVRRWPLIGWLSAKSETIFLERGSRSAAVRAKEHLVEQLRLRRRVGVFPEGTTSDGSRVQPFHGALFQSAIDAGVRVAPVAIRYTDAKGAISMAPAYVGDTSLWQCFRAIVTSSRITVHAAFLPTLDAGSSDRRHLAHRAHTAITHALKLTPSQQDQSDANTEAEIPDDLPGARPSANLPIGNQSQAPADSSRA
jgi:1-acyl-sn-glycerol-3-phosphate acyltransferase